MRVPVSSEIHIGAIPPPQALRDHFRSVFAQLHVGPADSDGGATGNRAVVHAPLAVGFTIPLVAAFQQRTGIVTWPPRISTRHRLYRVRLIALLISDSASAIEYLSATFLLLISSRNFQSDTPAITDDCSRDAFSL